MASMTRRRESHEPLANIQEPSMMSPLLGLGPLRLIRDLLGADPFAGTVAGVSTMFAPDFEIKETQDSYLIKADLPGVRDQDLDISIVGNRLTVSGKREEEERREDDRYFSYERAYGSFTRSFVMPEGADLDKIEADLDKGVLTVRVPKRAGAEARHVEIGGKESGGKGLSAGKQEKAGQEAQAGQPAQKKAG